MTQRRFVPRAECRVPRRALPQHAGRRTQYEHTMKSLTLVTVAGLWFLPLLSVHAVDLTITTYYPSPRGVYQELRTTDNTYLATLAGRVGIGLANPGAAKSCRPIGSPSREHPHGSDIAGTPARFAEIV